MTIEDLTETYLNALEGQNLETISSLLADVPTIDIPFSNTGDLAPWFNFEGREQALGYIATIFKNFSQVKLVDRTIYAANDGKTAFVETKGDLIQRDTGASYRNVYVFKLSMQDGRITHVREYANPVTFAKLMGIPLG
ncbi:nuclear transport factor 2 family protein [Oryzicola mucosus]|uniref:Nuclear transport factor 2 family protein n=1 Tax=Oryzicola mucosus TaxID=2767425 RepID=A0A8J6PNW4_9HYPH|nr:nuclear transport factor 2 family protein [Oryzicola mucosus]MBD0417051.1 nuclear transport factor 2 family protein [Oryzicola mucosus]